MVVLAQVFLLYFQIISLLMCLKMQQKMVKVPVLLILLREAWMEFEAPDFSLDQS